jgi:hypothetical protein
MKGKWSYDDKVLTIGSTLIVIAMTIAFLWNW